MKFYCRVDHFKNRQGFTVKNEQFHNVYKVKGSFFYGIKHLTIKDWNDEVMYRVRKQPSLRQKVYHIKDAKDTLSATIHRQKETLVCDFPSGEQYIVDTAEGRVRFLLNDQAVVTFQKEAHHQPDPLYAIEIAPNRKALLNLTCMIAVKHILLGHRERRD